jgi:hypothetical protein
MSDIADYKARCPANFNMIAISEKVTNKTPYIVVVL